MISPTHWQLLWVLEERCETPAAPWLMGIASMVVVSASFRASNDIFPQLKGKVSEGRDNALFAFFVLFSSL